MTERENNMRLIAEVLGLCYEISSNSEADCFFRYSPHVDCFDVEVFETGWSRYAIGEHYAEVTHITSDNLMSVLEKLYALRADMGGGL